MSHISTQTDQNSTAPAGENGEMKANKATRGELVVKGVGTAVAASILIQSGKGIMSTLTKHPFAIFGLGIASGYLTHKYRKEIILLTSKTAEQSKDFVLRQKDNLKDFPAETLEDTEEKDASQ
jgi:hypothetical protein